MRVAENSRKLTRANRWGLFGWTVGVRYAHTTSRNASRYDSLPIFCFFWLTNDARFSLRRRRKITTTRCRRVMDDGGEQTNFRGNGTACRANGVRIRIWLPARSPPSPPPQARSLAKRRVHLVDWAGHVSTSSRREHCINVRRAFGWAKGACARGNVRGQPSDTQRGARGGRAAEFTKVHPNWNALWRHADIDWRGERTGTHLRVILYRHVARKRFNSSNGSTETAECSVPIGLELLQLYMSVFSPFSSTRCGTTDRVGTAQSNEVNATPL